MTTAVLVFMGFLAAMLVLCVIQRARRRYERQRFEGGSVPAVLLSQAQVGALHAIEHGLPFDVWYQLEAFWTRFDDTPDEPESGKKVQKPASEVDAHEGFDLDAFVKRTSKRGCQVCGERSKYVVCPSCWGQQQQVAKQEFKEPDRLRTTWQLAGTDEDEHEHVLQALRNNGVKVGREGRIAHLAGHRKAIAAARAEYDAGFASRRRRAAQLSSEGNA